MLINLEVIMNFMSQLTVKKLELKSIVNHVNFNINALDRQSLRIYNLYKKNLKLQNNAEIE